MKKLCALIVLFLFLLPVCHAQTGVYRALCIANAHYDDGRVRIGGVNSAQGMFDCLSRCFGSQGSFISAMSVDLDKAEMMQTITEYFSEAAQDDVSLLYITAHGGVQCGVSYLETRDGKRLYAGELEEALRGIPGRIIILIDACNSGGFTGSESEFSELFSAAFALNSFASDKYFVLASCYLDENSYRVTAGSTGEKSVSTVFARSVCEGLGWDLISDHTTALKADINRDRRVSFAEITLYARRRALFYLSASPASVQSINAFSPNPGFILADRNPRVE